MRVLCAGGVAAIGMALLASPASAAGAIATSGFVQVQADATTNGGAASTSVVSSSWSGVPSTLGALGANTVSISTNGGSVAAFGTVYASWADADSGEFQGQDFGWNFNLAPADTGGGADLNVSPINWSYTFSTASNAVFNLTYDVTHVGNGIGLQGWDLYIDGIQVTSLGGPFSPDDSGAASFGLSGGQVHTVDLRNNANISGDLTGYQAYLNGTFDWNITAAGQAGGVPEPATWGLMLVGFFGLGGLLRRQSSLARVTRA